MSEEKEISPANGLKERNAAQIQQSCHGNLIKRKGSKGARKGRRENLSAFLCANLYDLCVKKSSRN